jgi:hypothetical protein
MPIDSTMSRKNMENKSARQYYGKFYSMENFIPKHFGQVKTHKTAKPRNNRLAHI